MMTATTKTAHLISDPVTMMTALMAILANVVVADVAADVVVAEEMAHQRQLNSMMRTQRKTVARFSTKRLQTSLLSSAKV